MTDAANDQPKAPFLRRLMLQNYKSIATCDVELEPFTALVGPNGAGKSNVLDSIRFVGDSLRNSLEHALRERGGINEVRRRARTKPRSFGVRLKMAMPPRGRADFAFRVGSSRGGGFLVQREECCLWHGETEGGESAMYRVEGGKLVGASRDLPVAIEQDRLFLGLVSGLPEFRPLFEGLTGMGFYNLSPARLRDLQDPDAARILARDGSNATTILRRMAGANPEVLARVGAYLACVAPEITGVKVKTLGPKETIEFLQRVEPDDRRWEFLAASMSDGTLRAFGILLALFQARLEACGPVPLIGIEEPEVALHPAAAHALASAILEAVDTTQVVVTSHSPDLLDHEDIPSKSILAVTSHEGQTLVGPVDPASKDALRDNLYTPGELLRLQQLEPDTPDSAQLELFDALETP